MYTERTLVIKPGGNIDFYRWDDKSKSWAPEDVTEFALRHLMEHVKLDPGVTMKDLFLILKKDLSVYSVIINNWVDEIVEEVFSDSDDFDKSDLKYIEFSWVVEVDDDKKYPTAPEMWLPYIHGIGPDDKGEDIKWGIDFMHSKSNLDTPIVLGDEVVFTETIRSNKKTQYNIKKYKGANYTLLQVLYGLIWELTFHGPPSKRVAKLEKLNEIVAEHEKMQEVQADENA